MISRLRLGLAPGIPQRHRTVKDGSAGARVMAISDEISMALELEALLGFGLLQRRFEVAETTCFESGLRSSRKSRSPAPGLSAAKSRS